jgi:hypothetical protein
MHPWTTPQLAAFLGRALEQSHHHAAWTLLAMTGMRPARPWRSAGGTSTWTPPRSRAPAGRGDAGDR